MKKQVTSIRNIVLQVLLFCMILLLTLESRAQQNDSSVAMISSERTISNADDKFCFHLNDYPDNGTPSWGDEDWAANGITHDKKYWYISSVSRNFIGQTDASDWILWKIPVSEPLDRDYTNNSNVTKWKHSSHPNILSQYNHAGDIDYCVYNGKGYVLVPLTGGPRPIIAFFRASDLHFINYAYLENFWESIGWCAANPKVEGDLYTSKDDANKIDRYDIDWHALVTSDTPITLTKIHIHYPILDKNGEQQTIHNMQGGEFTEDGKMFYISSGTMACTIVVPVPIPFCIGCITYVSVESRAYPEDGIHVLRASDFKEIQHSTNPARDQSGCFEFDFYNGDCWGREPEGLTIWDLNDGSAPHLRGQLHVLLDDHNFWTSNKVTLKHYKSFECPNDITVFGTTPFGVPKSNSQIANFLNEDELYVNCGIVTNDAPLLFYPGVTTITFSVRVSANETVTCKANVTVKNKHDECSTAMPLFACNKLITDNYCAQPSASVPGFSCYNGNVKDVWFKINPSSSSISVETFQVTNGLSNLVMQAFSGSCGHLQEIACDDSSGEGEHAKITLTNLVTGTPIYVRVTDYNANNYGKFGIYYRKLAEGQDIFDGEQFISGDGAGVHDHPALMGDVNGDGAKDLIFVFDHGNNGLTTRTKLSNGDGTYTSVQQIMGDGPGVYDHPTLTGDVNGDGRTDLIFVFDYGNSGLTTRTKLSNGDGTYTGVQQIMGDGAGVHDYPALTGDVNGDGKTDLVFIFDHGNNGLTTRTKLSNGDGTYTSVQQIMGDGAGVHDYPALAGDFNGDGKTDLVFIFDHGNNGLTTRTKFSNGDGTYISVQQIMGDGAGVHAYPTLTGDVNADGRTDLIFVFDYGNSGLTIRTKLSNADGTYTNVQEILGDGAGVHEYPTLTGDVNGDGKTDLIFTGQNWTSCGLNIRVKISKGDGTWCEGWQGMGDGAGVHQYPTFAGDINGDRKTDLLYIFDDSNEGLILRTKIAQSVNFCQMGGTMTPVNTGKTNQSGDITRLNHTDSGWLNDQFSIYPNPTTGIIELVSKDAGELEVCIRNATGIIVFPKQNFSGSKEFNLKTLASGIYFVDIYDKKKSKKVVKRVIKM